MIEFALALSLHLGLEGDYNEIHPHVRYTNEGTIAGAYYNSVDKISFYVGRRWEYGAYGLEAAAVTGYPKADIVPYVRATYNDFFISPALEGDTVGVVVGYEFKW